MAKALPLHAVNPHESLRSNAPLMLHTRLEELYQFAPYISDPANVEELHNMRIAAKRLRYTLEIFQPCFSGKDFSKVYDQVKSVQEQIGEIHDRDVRGPLLQAFLEARVGDRPEIRVGLERLIQNQQSDIDRVQAGAQKFLDDAPNMSSMEITTAGMALSHSLAMVNMKMQVATSLTQGSNKSLQTLLKNQ